MWDQPAEVIGAFQSKEEAEAYALKSFWLGKTPLSEGAKVSAGNFVAVPWTCKKGSWYEET
jgi:hypothetical protein